MNKVICWYKIVYEDGNKTIKYDHMEDYTYDRWSKKVPESDEENDWNKCEWIPIVCDVDQDGNIVEDNAVR